MQSNCVSLTMFNIMHPINERILEIIKTKFDNNKSQFANAIGVPPTMMSSYFSEKRASKPNIDMLSNIINMLGVDARWLMTGKEYNLGGVEVSQDHGAVNVMGSQDVFIGVPAEIRDRIAHLESLLAEKERLITEKDERIAELKERIEELKERK